MARPGDESRASRWRRRAITLPLPFVGAAVWLLALPALLPLAAALDAFARDRRCTRVRLALFAGVYLAAECAGLLAALALRLWPARHARYLERNYRLQGLWAGSLFAAARALFRLDLEVAGEDALRGPPVIVFARHASLVDVLLPAVLVARRHGIRLRWVLKRELLADPCLDVVGNRLPNCFVRRDSDQSAREIERVAALARTVGPGGGILIYPEGTRATDAKRRRALARVGASSPERLARVEKLVHLLPPRVGGPLALLRERPDLDVVILGHAGLEGLTGLRQILRGLVGRRICFATWRHPAASMPRSDAERLAWLDARWSELDRWVDARIAAGGSAP